MTRNHSIDAFRGFAIIGMIFFTITLRLSDDLPELLRHNVWGSVHLGDFILPMFLFASGLSLAYYFQKKQSVTKKVFVQSVLHRFFILALVGVSLSFFSAYGFLEMDEVMLSALLFIVCVVLYRFDWKIILGIVLVIDFSYVVLMYLNYETIFIGHYLGGYPAAIYYLPVMLIGLVIGKGLNLEGLWCRSNLRTMAMIFVFFLIFSVITPFNKMSASPSFMMLAILVSFLVFGTIDGLVVSFFSFGILQKIGRRPLRYWILMYLIFLVPLWFYVERSGQNLPFGIYWYFAIGISIGVMLLLFGVSSLFEYVAASD